MRNRILKNRNYIIEFNYQLTFFVNLIELLEDL